MVIPHRERAGASGFADRVGWSNDQGTRLDRFLAATDWAVALANWLGPEACRSLSADRGMLKQRLDRDIAYLDEQLNQQVNAVLHHRQFQALEASWRGLRYLVDSSSRLAAERTVRIRVLDISWRELARDLERAMEFDQSQFFEKVYTREFGSPGGEPFGLLIGDYFVRHRPGLAHADDDVAVLKGISQVSAAAFAPFITGVHPALFGLDSFHELGLPIDLQRVFRQQEYRLWQTLRDFEESRFIGLVLPHILLRLPYEDDGSRVDGFPFHESVATRDNQCYLWGNAAFAFAAVAIQAFDNNGWLADIRGVRQNEETGRMVAAGGLVSSLPVASFTTDRSGLAPRFSTDVQITQTREKELDELGLISLCHCWDTPWSAFYSNSSVQAPKTYDSAAASVNARLSSMLQYTLCVSRFAHFIKIIGRAKVGTVRTAHELETLLQNWFLRYSTAREDSSLDEKARYPLREARVQVKAAPGKPGSFICTAHLRPHFQLEQLVAAIRLETEITPAKA